ncbi:unnamed protein product [Pseudo-nitzschia multistriata]|uniref:Transmembrane 9 superfamily member n=1 Tax=Pseudo-nitzschia multistriata TaxID=183589 RepID=A0A448ZFA0_9STRA|nr:unnamed protein product [Pseudo-nitzschia multistriata]
MLGKQTILLLLGLFSSIAIVDGAKKIRRVKSGKIYKEHENVHIVVNKVGPFNNPTETYRYYSLPFCHEHSTEEEESDAALEEEVELHKFQGIKQVGAQRHKQRLGESIE